MSLLLLFYRRRHAGGPALTVLPGIIQVPRPEFTCTGTARICICGAAETSFQEKRPRPSVRSVQGRCSLQIATGPEARDCFLDPFAEIRQLDDELMLLE